MRNFFEKLFIGEQPRQEKKKSLLATMEEEVLENREKKGSKELGGGANITILIELKDDGSGIFKPKSGEKTELRENIKKGTYFKRERAAYLVDRFLGFNLVPPTTIREIDGEIGSIQQFIPDAQTGFDIGYEELRELRSDNALTHGFMMLWIFDYIIYNSDRHDGNFLVKNDRIYAIDHGLTFGNTGPTGWESDASFFNTPIPEEVKAPIEKFLSWKEGKEILKDLLLELLVPLEVESCLKRIEKVGQFVKDGAIPSGAKLTF